MRRNLVRHKGIMVHGVNGFSGQIDLQFCAFADDRQIFWRPVKAGEYLNLVLCFRSFDSEVFSLAWGNGVYAAAVLCERFGLEAADVKGDWECLCLPAPYWVGRYDTMENFRRDVKSVLLDFKEIKAKKAKTPDKIAAN